MIYAIEAVGTEYIKFGRANSVGKRLAELNVASPHELNIVAIADWPDEAEKTIHFLLGLYKQKGEWFKNSAETQNIISLMNKGCQGLTKLKHAARKNREQEESSVKTASLAPARGDSTSIIPQYQAVAMVAWANAMRDLAESSDARKSL